MNIYDKIKNPIYSDKGLRKIVDAYLDDSERSFYSRAVSYGEKNNRFNEEEFNKFKRMIDNKELDNIRAYSTSEVIKKSFKASLANHVKNYSLLSKSNRLNKIASNYFRCNPPTYKMYNYVKNHSNEEILNRYEQIMAGNTKISINDQIIINIMDEYILNKHKFDRLAGFHVYQHELEKTEIKDLEKKYKIYINLNYDQLYKFAAKYMEICKKANVEYTFKLLSPITDIPDRSEKMCIYCDEENFYQTIDILKAIKGANRGLKPGNPPIFAGVLDNWIGIGSDPRDKSFNGHRAECIEKALDNYFKGMTKNQAKKMIEKNPKLLKEIREAIENEASSMRIATKKFCFTRIGNNRIKNVDNNYKSGDLVLDKSALKIEGLTGNGNSGAYFDKYVDTRLKYGKDSVEVQELIKKIKVVSDNSTAQPRVRKRKATNNNVVNNSVESTQHRVRRKKQNVANFNR